MKWRLTTSSGWAFIWHCVSLNSSNTFSFIEFLMGNSKGKRNIKYSVVIGFWNIKTISNVCYILNYWCHSLPLWRCLQYSGMCIYYELLFLLTYFKNNVTVLVLCKCFLFLSFQNLTIKRSSERYCEIKLEVQRDTSRFLVYFSFLY